MAQERARISEQALLQLLLGAAGHTPVCDIDEEELIQDILRLAQDQLAFGAEPLGLVDTDLVRLQTARASVPGIKAAWASIQPVSFGVVFM